MARLRWTLRTRVAGAALVLALIAGADAGPASRSPPPRLPPQTPGPAPAEGSSAEVASAIRRLLAPSGPQVVGVVEERRALATIYPASLETLLWVDPALRPGQAAREALTIMGDAAAEGLDPRDYRTGPLNALAQTLSAAAAPPRPEDVASFDVGLSLSLMRYLRQMHRGRVDPRAIGFRLDLPADEHDYAALTREAAIESRVKETIRSMTPPVVQYQFLRARLPLYRELARAEGATLPALPDPPRASLKPGEPAAGLDPLRLRLIALGDLPNSAAPIPDPGRYEGEIVEGVKRFQFRHGLEADGIMGKSTWAALAVPLSRRVRQIELAMERIRWLPHLGGHPFIAVNIPMFRLWGWDTIPETGAPLFEMGVIVGKALHTRTPVFLEEMEYLIFRPYWNVPASIVKNEILPGLRRDLGYLSRQDMEMVDGAGDEARPQAPTAANVERLARGELRLRQRPGPKNALGGVKFIFPNDEDVYLHGTPAPELFGRARRDFSHGCVRVEDPLLLSEWVLKDQPEWTRERILAAMNGAPSRRVPLTRKIQVVLYYVTAAVIPQDGRIHFAEDIYGQDPRLDQALAESRRKTP